MTDEDPINLYYNKKCGAGIIKVPPWGNKRVVGVRCPWGAAEIFTWVAA